MTKAIFFKNTHDNVLNYLKNSLFLISTIGLFLEILSSSYALCIFAKDYILNVFKVSKDNSFVIIRLKLCKAG